MSTKLTDNQLVEKLKKRLATASQGDRIYERPMSWDEADQFLEIIARTERNRDMWQNQCERQADQLTKLHADREPSVPGTLSAITEFDYK